MCVLGVCVIYYIYLCPRVYNIHTVIRTTWFKCYIKRMAISTVLIFMENSHSVDVLVDSRIVLHVVTFHIPARYRGEFQYRDRFFRLNFPYNRQLNKIKIICILLYNNRVYVHGDKMRRFITVTMQWSRLRICSLLKRKNEDTVPPKGKGRE